MLPKHVRYQTAPHPGDGGCASQATEQLYHASHRCVKPLRGINGNFVYWCQASVTLSREGRYQGRGWRFSGRKGRLHRQPCEAGKHYPALTTSPSDTTLPERRRPTLITRCIAPKGAILFDNLYIITDRQRCPKRRCQPISIRNAPAFPGH